MQESESGAAVPAKPALTTDENEAVLDALVNVFNEFKSDASGSLSRQPEQIKKFLEDKKSLIDKINATRVTKETFDNKDKKLLGKGGYGQVYLVRHNDTKEIFAMKCMLKDKLLKDQSGFMEERTILAHGKTCEWVIQLHYAFQDNQMVYLVMDFMNGGDLVRLLDTYEFDENQTKFYAAECVNAINAIHSFGFIHRDVKPDNILLDRTGHVKIGDFGTCIAMVENSNKVRFASGPGTVDYVCPETLENASQRRMCAYGPELDWWSFGIMVYEMLFGETPFADDSMMITQNKIMNYSTALTFPDEVPLQDVTKKFIKAFLTDKSHRLGRNGPTDISDITGHDFFRGVDWTFESIRRFPPPFPVETASETDLSNFDEAERTRSNNFADSQLTSTRKDGFQGKQLPFIGFSYNTLPEGFGEAPPPAGLTPKGSKKGRKISLAREPTEQAQPDEKLVKELESLKTQLKSKQEELNKTVGDLHILEVEKQNVESKLESQSHELAELTHRNNENRNKIDDLEREGRELENEKLQTESKLESLTDIISTSNQAKTEEEQKIRDLTVELGQLKTKEEQKVALIKEYESNISRLKNDIDDKSRHLKKQSTDIESLTADNEVLSRKIGSKDKEISRAKESLIMVEEEKKVLSMELAVKQQAVLEGEESIEKLAREKEHEQIMKTEVIYKLTNVMKQQATLESQLKNHKGIHGMSMFKRAGASMMRATGVSGMDRKEDLAKLERENKKLKNELHREKQSHESVLLQRDEKISKIEQENQDLQERLEKLELQLREVAPLNAGSPLAAPRHSLYLKLWIGVEQSKIPLGNDPGCLGDGLSELRLTAATQGELLSNKRENTRKTRRRKPDLKFVQMFAELNPDDHKLRLYDNEERTRIIQHWDLRHIMHCRKINENDIHKYSHNESKNMERIFQVVVMDDSSAETIMFQANNAEEKTLWTQKLLEQIQSYKNSPKAVNDVVNL